MNNNADFEKQQGLIVTPEQDNKRVLKTTSNSTTMKTSLKPPRKEDNPKSKRKNSKKNENLENSTIKTRNITSFFKPLPKTTSKITKDDLNDERKSEEDPRTSGKEDCTLVQKLVEPDLMGNDRCTLSTSNFFIDQPDLAPGSKRSFLLSKPRLSDKSYVPNETKVGTCKTNSENCACTACRDSLQ